MGVVNLRDAIILSLLKNGLKSRWEIENSLGVQKKIAKESISFLRKSKLISRRNLKGDEFYDLTESGRKAIDKVFRQVSPRQIRS